jgi:L-rhamnose mutarotase
MEPPQRCRLAHLLHAATFGGAASPVPTPAAASAPSALELAGPSGFAPMVSHLEVSSFTGGGGCTADGLIRKCSMLKVRDGGPELMAGYNEWHRKVWPEMQAHIRRTGTTNCETQRSPAASLTHPATPSACATMIIQPNPCWWSPLTPSRLPADSIFQRSDGVLFLYEEVNETLAATAAAEGDSVTARWQKLMDPYLLRDNDVLEIRPIYR